LRCVDQADVQGRVVPEALHDALAILDNAEDGVAGVSARRLADELENLSEAFNMSFSFLAMGLESRVALGEVAAWPTLGRDFRTCFTA